jgi:phospholipid/cholesterol/gamma-HCH transport system substrate-binding protein
MANRTSDNIKLGVFALTGLVLVVAFLYLLGKNQSIFSTRFPVKAHFENVNGLTPGSNVRVSGIVVGVVESVNLINDTLVEVELRLDDEMRRVVRKNTLADISTDGLVGNRVVNLLPAKESAPMIEPGDIIQSQKDVSTAEMLKILNKTNQNVLVISEGLLETVERINKSTQLTTLLQDESLSRDLKAALANLRVTTATASATATDLRSVMAGIRAGEGTVGALLRDTTLAHELNLAARKLHSVETQAGQLVQNMDSLVRQVALLTDNVQTDIRQGPGTAHLLLRDSLAAARIQTTLGNIEQGTARFNESMEGLKNSFLLRRYFRKQEKKNQKE